MTRQEIYKHLLSKLNYELDAYRRLQALLLEQHKHMSQHKTQMLAEINASEQSLLAELRKLAQQRSQLLRSIGLNADEQGMKHFLAELPQSLRDKAEPVWEQIYQQLCLCKSQNELNGRLLATQQDLIKRMLFGEPDPDYSSLA